MGTVFGLFYQFLAGRGTGLTLHGSSVENSVLPKTSYEQLILPGKSRFFRFDSALGPLWVRFGSPESGEAKRRYRGINVEASGWQSWDQGASGDDVLDQPVSWKGPGYGTMPAWAGRILYNLFV